PKFQFSRNRPALSFIVGTPADAKSMRRRGTRAARADYLHEGGSRQEIANTARTAQSFDDLMTIGLATVLTILASLVRPSPAGRIRSASISSSLSTRTHSARFR